jgi:aspartate aminotransferase
MIAQQYKEMLNAKSVIRQMSEWATNRACEIGSENVYDFSLGNPSVPVPQEFTDKMIELLQTKDTMELHGYSQTGNTKGQSQICRLFK